MIEELMDSLFGIGVFTTRVYMLDKAGESFYLMKKHSSESDKNITCLRISKFKSIYKNVKNFLTS